MIEKMKFVSISGPKNDLDRMVNQYLSHYEIQLENYCKTVLIEAETMVDMARKEILPAVERYARALSDSLLAKTAAVPGLACRYERELISRLSAATDEIDACTAALASSALTVRGTENVTAAARLIRDDLLPRMAELRVVCDEAETVTDESFWPFPTYGKLLFGVK